MIDFDTVKSAILTSNFTEEQLIELHHAIKTSRVELAWQERNFVPEKVDRIAAVLIGYSRLLGTNETRNKVNLHKHFHKYFTSIAKNVDYYILSWIPNDFQSETKTVPLFETLWPNKLFFKLYDDSDLDFNTYNKTLKLTYLAKLADVEIQKAETRGNFTYDYVIETRLDNYISFHNFSNIKSLEENEIISHAGHMGAKAPGRKWDSEMDSINDFEMPGWYFRTNSLTYHNFSDRFDFFMENYSRLFPEEYSTNIHKDMAYYFKQNLQYKISQYDDFIKYFFCVTLDQMPPPL